MQQLNGDDEEMHWLWGSVNRIRRSLDQLLGTSAEDKTDIKNKNDTKTKTNKVHKNTNQKRPKKHKSSNKRRKHKKATRRPRQVENGYADDDEEENEITEGSGLNVVDEDDEDDLYENGTENNVFNGIEDEKPEVLCKYALKIIIQFLLTLNKYLYAFSLCRKQYC